MLAEINRTPQADHIARSRQGGLVVSLQLLSIQLTQAAESGGKTSSGTTASAPAPEDGKGLWDDTQEAVKHTVNPA